MRVVGVAVAPNKGRPTANVVVLEGDWSSPTVVDQFPLTSVQDSTANKLHELAGGLSSYLTDGQVQRVMIRRADFSANSSAKAEGPKMRLLAEGALAAASRGHVTDVEVLTGKELGDRSPAANKNAMDAHAQSVCPDCDVQAAAAALAGLA